ncbi:protein FAM171A2 isoform X2 [Phyllopteryx taeniolatus]|uniref:protein FAM171A2 isoform X2 n=1 Tax=Phyllopteryx taeniolatus TaxID=161469 RepID=UPI002AD45279|nr:protein FAM171A2 isoform X2 [Phyllopteryx taeniolatus]
MAACCSLGFELTNTRARVCACADCCCQQAGERTQYQSSPRGAPPKKQTKKKRHKGFKDHIFFFFHEKHLVLATSLLDSNTRPGMYTRQVLLVHKSTSKSNISEVQIKVQVLDSSDLSPLADALVQVHGNQSVSTSARAGADGTVRVDFRYRAATWVIISASKPDYVTNSVPWYSGRPPLYASVSLYLLARRPGTLILYDDVLQILSSSPGADSGWTDLTPLALVSIELSDKDGDPVAVSDSIHVSVPLPSDTRNRMATSVPTWMYQHSTGLWVRNGTGYVQKEDSHFVWNAVLPQTGSWLAAFPASSGLGPSHPGLRDINTYHTLFLLAILGSLALLVLILLCVLLYYSRRRCLKPRRQPGKPLPSNANGAKRDQGTSTSRLNLICGGHAESGPSDDKSDLSPSRDYRSSREDLTEQLRRATGKNASGSQRGESFALKVTRATDTKNPDNPLLREDYNRAYGPTEGGESDYHRHRSANDNRGYSSDPPSPPRFQGYVPSQPDKPPEYSAAAADGLARPTSLGTQPGQIIFCSSIDQMKENMYRSMVPTLVIPAHYMRLPSEFAAKDGKEQKEPADKDGVQVGGAQQKQGQRHQGGPRGDDSEEPGWASDPSAGPVTIPVLFNDSAMAQMNGELQALTEKKLLELGVKQHPRAWFISLDGRANAHVRHSYIDAGNDLSGGGFGGGLGSSPRDANLAPPLEAQERGGGREAKDERWEAGRKGRGGAGKSYSKLAYPDLGDPGEGRPVSPEENSLTPLLDEGPPSRGRAIPGRGRDRDSAATSPEDDADDKEENKKSPWQKIEDRPLMVFHPRK